MSQHKNESDLVDWSVVHRSNFASAAFSSAKWIQKGIDLFESAKLLEPRIQELWGYWRSKSEGRPAAHVPNHFLGTYFMLMSFCVENFLKAALVQAESSRYKREFKLCVERGMKSKKCFPSELKTHDLFDLSIKAKLDLQEGEEDLLRRLSRCAEWAGRYPSPLRYEDMFGTETFSDGADYSLSWFGERDVEKLNSFIPSLPQRLDLHTSHWEQKAP
jgi:hypothetical protein